MRFSIVPISPTGMLWVRSFLSVVLVTPFLLKDAFGATWDTGVIMEQGQVVPPAASPAAASGFIQLDTVNNQLNFNINLDSALLGNEGFAGIFGPANLGENGPLLFQLPNGFPKNGSWAYPDSIEPILLSNLTYIQVETDLHPQGEIRGQLAAWQANGLTQSDALDYLVRVIVPASALVDSMNTFFVGLGTPDSMLVAGDVVADLDSTFTFNVTADTYFFWFNNDPMLEWTHSTTFMFMDAFTGQIVTHEGQTWPVINGQERFLTDDEAVGCNLPPLAGVQAPYTPVDTPNTNDWAIIIVGKNGGQKQHAIQLEKEARLSDINRIKRYLNGLDKGPGVDKDKIITVPGVGTLGATLAEVCAALDSISGCKKLHFYYIGHGSKEKAGGKRGYLLLRKPPPSTKTEKFSYHKLACKLLETGVPEVCVTIEACHSGHAIKPMKRKRVRGKKLKGTVVTSSTGVNKTRRAPDGSFFIKAFLTCALDPFANFNNDNRTTNVEIAAWAEANDVVVQLDSPQGALLGDERDLKFVKKRVKSSKLYAGGPFNLTFEIHTFKYTIKTAGGKDSTVTKKKVFVLNHTDKLHLATKKIELLCPRQDFVLKVPAPIQHTGKSNAQNSKTFLGEIPPDCVCFYTRDAFNQKPLLPDSVNTLITRTTAYRPGEFLLQGFDITGLPGDIFSVTLDSIPNWNMSLDKIEFNSVAPDTQAVALRGCVPPGAVVGGRFGGTIINMVTLSDTTHLEIDALLYDSLATNILAGETHLFHALDMYGGGLDARGGVVRLDSTSMLLHVPAAISVPVGGRLETSLSQIAADSGVAFALDILGGATLDNINFVRPLNGLHLAPTDSVAVTFCGVQLSAGDGLVLTGDQSLSSIEGLLLDSAADDGIEASGVSNALLEFVIIENAGDQDVVLASGSTLELRNSYFDDTRVLVDPSSQLTRSWSTAVVVQDSNGVALDQATVEIFDVFSNPVATLTTDSLGVTSGVVLRQFVQNGTLRTVFTPYSITATRGGVSTTISHALTDKQFVSLIMTGVVVDAGDGQEIDSPRSLVLEQNSPNPFGSSRLGTSTSISYALPQPGDVRIVIYNVRGRLVEEYRVGHQRPGLHVFNLQAESYSSGIYWYQLRTPLGTQKRKMLIIK